MPQRPQDIKIYNFREKYIPDDVAMIGDAIKFVSEIRARLGAQENRLEHAYKSNRNKEENTTAAESRIRDTDMAKEMVKDASLGILQQAGQSMLAQAQRSNQGVLSLLG